MLDIIYLAAAGALGAVSRYALSGLTQRFMGPDFPYGTLLVNVLGSMLLGFLVYMGINTNLIPQPLRTALTIGFLGAFTTFSTFSYETASYLGKGDWFLATVNVLANVGLCILAVLAGMFLARLLTVKA
jgi:CrcB protein